MASGGIIPFSDDHVPVIIHSCSMIPREIAQRYLENLRRINNGEKPPLKPEADIPFIVVEKDR